MRHLRPGLIKLELDTVEDEELAEDPQGSIRYLRGIKEQVLLEIVSLFEADGNVANSRKLFADLLNRERKSSTALGHGVAVPHVRTMQAREMIVAFLMSTPGIHFDAPDDEPVHIFFAMVTPPYQDQTYLKLYRSVAKMFSSPSVPEDLMNARGEGEIRKILRRYL